MFDDDDPLDVHDIGDVVVTLAEPGIACWSELIYFKVVGIGAATAPTASPSPIIRQLILMLASEW